MRNNAIGVFDSGLGGLTAVKELLKLMPGEDMVYFGDTSRVPYGTRDVATIIHYARQDLNFLNTFNIKAALVACGTISAVALKQVKDDYPFEIVGVIDSAAKAAVKTTKNKKIGIIGTPATIKSNAYGTTIKELDSECEVISVACPLFVPLVENGHIEKYDPLIQNAVQLYLKQIVDFGADTIILGCTHYPIIAHTIGEYVGEDVILINPGREAVRTLHDSLEKRDLLSQNQNGNHSYYVSDSVENFVENGSFFLHRSINGDVYKVDIEKY